MNDPHDVAHHAQRAIGLRQAWTLLDVKLEVCGDLARVALRERGIALLAERTQGVGDRDTTLVGAFRGTCRKPAERGRGSEQPDPEPRPFLVGPRDHLDRTLETRTHVEQRLDRLDRADHAERSIETTALGHRINM
jgi:hypothetical protein